MARSRKTQSGMRKNGGDLGFKAKLWQAADALCNNMDAAEYKHVVLGLILRKYGYPPDKQEKATRTVLEQAEALSEAWAVA